MEKFTSDDRLNPSHISMYLALFQYWNLSRFSNPISINREEIMKLSKIGSKSTYHKCIRQLHHWDYLEYLPSHNPFKGSKVIMFNFGTSSEQALVHNRPINGQALVSSKTYINNKHIKQNIYKEKPKNLNEVKMFFSEIKSNKIEAQRFFNYYESTGWKISGKTPIQNWKAAARNWILNSKKRKNSSQAVSRETSAPLVQKTDNLKTTKNKNYNEPL
jgi:hypothetical protein